MQHATRLRWMFAAVIIFGIVYLTSFIALRYWFLPIYEISRLPERHWLRPAYEFIYFPLRLLDANGWSVVPREPRVRIGKVAEVNEGKLVFDYGESTLTVGFVCVPEACAELKTVRLGDEVEAIFGGTLVSGTDNFINKLLSVRVCTPDDHKCASSRERQRLEDLEVKRLREASAKKHHLCSEAMEQTLSKDSRYVGTTISDKPPDQEVVDRFNALAGDKKKCGDSIIDAHRRAVFESCKKHGCGDDVGGGCWHMADGVHIRVIAHALEKCGT